MKISYQIKHLKHLSFIYMGKHSLSLIKMFVGVEHMYRICQLSFNLKNHNIKKGGNLKTTENLSNV